jgi:hypothetical protein
VSFVSIETVRDDGTTEDLLVSNEHVMFALLSPSGDNRFKLTILFEGGVHATATVDDDGYEQVRAALIDTEARP